MSETYYNFQGSAAFAVIVFFGVFLAEALAGVAAIVLVARGRQCAARRVAVGASAVAALYLTTLVGFSLASREQVVGLRGEKYFCEVDCHLAYSVVRVSEARSLGSGGDRAAARGVFRVVTLRVRFDEDTISSHRARDLPLTPNPRLVRIVDSSGAAYPIDPAGQKALEAAEGEEIPLSRPLKAGESYATRLVFDVPKDARDLRLLLTEASPVTRFLIGHENSLFHKKVFFSGASTAPERANGRGAASHGEDR